MKRFFALLLAACMLLSLPCLAADEDIGSIIEPYMAGHGLNEKNFALGWMDLESGETWYFGRESFMVAGSMYKLPLNMVLTDMIAAGQVQPTDITRGYMVERAMELSIVYSDNDAAQALRYRISHNRDEYRNALAQYSGYSPEELPEEYYTENRMSPRFVLNTLKYLYDNSEAYSALLGNMRLAHKGHYFQKDNEHLDIAHKYGYFEGWLNDCGIVYADRPFALVVFTQNVANSEKVLSELCALAAGYEYVPEPEPAPTPEPTPEPAPQNTPEVSDLVLPEEEEPNSYALIAAAVVTAVILSHFGKKGMIAALAVLLMAAAYLLAGCTQRGPEPEPTTTPAPVAAHTPEPTPTPTPEPTPEPPREYTLSFAGDCTIGTLHEWQGQQAGNNMLYVMNGDMSYPFSHVRDIFENDDLTMVNLEGTFTNETKPKGKDYRFRAAPEYAAALTAGSVEAVTLANNHSGDYLEAGLIETRSALENEGVLWSDETKPLITTLGDDLKVGVITFNCVEIDLAVGDVEGYMQRIAPMYEKCAAENCDIILAYIHWGWEYREKPESWMVELARRTADLGCAMVIGSHAHILQPYEDYGGVPIYYSLANFAFGGHSAPKDMDTVILRQTIIKDGEGVRLGERELIPCSISSTPGINDFRPTPYEEGSEEWNRVLKKMEICE